MTGAGSDSEDAAQGDRPRVQAGRKAMLALLSNLASAALGYAILLLIGRFFEPQAYGSYLFAVGVVGFLAIVVNLGFSSAHQRHVAMGVPVGQALGVMLRIRLLGNAAFLVLVGASYALWAWLHGPDFTDATTPRILAAAVILQMLAGSRQLLLDTWIGEQRVNRVEALRLADTLLAFGVLANACLLIAHLQGRWTPFSVVGAGWADLFGLTAPLSTEQTALLLTGAYLSAKAATLLVALVWALADRVKVAGWDAALARSYAKFAIPVAITGALGLVLSYTDTILLGFFWTAREVGLYGAAQKLSILASLLGAALAGVLFPRFAQLHADGRHEREEATFRLAERYLVLLTAPVAAALIAMPRQGIHIAVGDHYLAAALPLQLLAGAAVLMTLEQPMASRFLGRGQTRLLVHSSALNAGLNLLLNLWFIPSWGLHLGPTGAALATLLSTALSYAYLRVRCRQAFGTPLVAASHLRILGAGALVGLGLWWAGDALPAAWFARVWMMLGWGVVALAVDVLLLLALGELTATDRRFLAKAAHPRELLAELRGL